MKTIINICTIIMICITPVAGHAHNVESKTSPLNVNTLNVNPNTSTGIVSPDWGNVGTDERLGQKVPGDIFFSDEYGSKILFSKLVDRPTIILPVYYQCKDSCAMMIANLASVIGDVPLKPGKDYRVISLSIDDEDTTSAALEAKSNYTKLLKKGYPENSWNFLTGDKKNIQRFTDAVGFRFKKSGKHEFVHPNVIIVLARDGTVIRYLYGQFFLPFDLGMAVTEAQKGTPSVSVRKLLSYCFGYDPEKKFYTLRVVRLTVLGTVALLGLLMFFLLRKKTR